MKDTLTFLIFLSLCGAASAQSRGYVFLAPGAVTAGGHSQRTYQLGGGGELRLPHGIGAGVELGALGPGERFASNVFGLFSLNGYYHPLHGSQRKADPFVTAGYSLAFRESTANLANFGGGINYWFRDNLALLLEFRDHVWPQSRITAHYWGFRVGLSFHPGD